MQQFYSRTWAAFALEGFTATNFHHVRRILAWSAVVFAAIFVGLVLWITALQTFGLTPVTGVGYDLHAWFNNDTTVNDSVDNNRAFRSHSVTKAFRKKYLDAHLKCFSETGRWVYDPTPRHLPWNYVGHAIVSRCDLMHQISKAGNLFGDLADEAAARGDSANWTVRDTLKWVWQTKDSCPWQPVNRLEFCRLIGSNRHVMIVGDSLSAQIAWSMKNVLVPGNQSTNENLLSALNPQHEDPRELCDDVFGKGTSFNLSFVRNDRLSLITVAEKESGNFYESPWINLLQERGVKLLLLNRGAHYEDDIIYRAALRNAFTILSLQFPEILVIYRNTGPGHVNCAVLSEPLSSPWSSPSSEGDFHWEDFQRQNKLAKEITEDFGYIYMDSATMLGLRPDGHLAPDRDCLHYCIPGPLDIVPEYLYNILSLIRDLDVI